MTDIVQELQGFHAANDSSHAALLADQAATEIRQLREQIMDLSRIRNWQLMDDKMRARFRSGNDVAVERAWITAVEWDSWLARLSAAEEFVSAIEVAMCTAEWRGASGYASLITKALNRWHSLWEGLPPVERLSELRKNALRYLWLKDDMHCRSGQRFPIMSVLVKFKGDREGTTWANVHDLDAVIDAAMEGKL